MHKFLRMSQKRCNFVADFEMKRIKAPWRDARVVEEARLESV